MKTLDSNSFGLDNPVQQVEKSKNLLEASKNAELFENLKNTHENLSLLQNDIIAWDKEKLDQKEFTWDQRTQTLSYFYLIGKRDVFMSFQILGDKIKVVFDATNTLWWNYEKEDKVISIDKKDINDLPEMISSTFDTWFNFTTAFWSKENLTVSRSDTLEKIKDKAEKAVGVVKKYL